MHRDDILKIVDKILLIADKKAVLEYTGARNDNNEEKIAAKE
jgi:hypothetical protein